MKLKEAEKSIFLGDDLTTRNSTLFNMARNMVAEKTIFQTWTKDGKFNIQNNRIL
jgi:hypothetical protein